MIRKNRSIHDDFKRKVVLEVISGNLSKEEARRIFDVRGKSAITDWVRRFGAEFLHFENPIVGLPAMAKSSKPPSVEELQSEIDRLNRLLQEEKHKAGLFKTMIEIAEEKFKIEIRKKSGAKQSIDTKSK